MSTASRRAPKTHVLSNQWGIVLSVLLFTLALSLHALPAHSQYFVRITDPDNPIVTDPGPSGYSGVTWVDFDNDGDLDCFVANDSNQTNKYYENNGDGTITSWTEGSIVEDVGSNRGASAGDYDNDGDIDLIVQGQGSNMFLYRNDLSGDNGWLNIRCRGIRSNRSARTTPTPSTRRQRFPS